MNTTPSTSWNPSPELEAGVGIDLAAVPDRTFRLREVLESWSASGFHRSPIGGGFEENTGYLVFHPTFSKGASLGTAEQRRASLNGFAVAALRIDRLVAESVTGIERTGFLVVDETPGVLKRELYQYQPSRSAGVPQPELVSEQDEGLESQIRAGIHKIEPLEIAGRRWSLLLHPVPGSLKSHSPFQRWVVLASGLVATALLGAYLFSRSNRSRRIETHAVALTQANENLARENAERRRAETALRESEERARASLTEKEVLLKEVHHRVKNNLQLISSLLNLQAAKSPDAPGVEMLHDSRNRVKAMALIHDKLYRSGDFANIDFGDYARGLVADLFHSYKTDPTAVSSHVDIDDVKLTVETAMPCGLIINELIANALEHGFPDGRSGEVRIQLHAVDDQTALLTVRDTGVGFPEELDFRQTESLGMQLVTTLTDQIGGAIELDRSGGTAFRIRFPVHHLSAIDAGLKSEAAAMAAHSEQSSGSVRHHHRSRQGGPDGAHHGLSLAGDT